MILVINTTDKEKIAIALAKPDGNLVFKDEFDAQFQHSEKLLPAIDQLLKVNKVELIDLKGILVVSGPGGFTALRIGIMTANTLSFALKIPVVGVKLSEFESLQSLIKIGLSKMKKAKQDSLVLPYYGCEPHITKPKKKIWS